MIKGSDKAKEIMQIVRSHKIVNKGKGLNDVIKYAFNKSKFGISIKVDNLLSKIGDEIVHSLKIVRTPINNNTIKVIELLSPNFKRKNTFDSLFHLGILINGRYILEKNEQVNITIDNIIPPKSDTFDVVVYQRKSIFEMLRKTREFMGEEKFIGYSSKNNNCQDFLLAFLQSNDLLTQQSRVFIKQNTNDLFTDDLRKTANTITDFKRNIINPVSDVLF